MSCLPCHGPISGQFFAESASLKERSGSLVLLVESKFAGPMRKVVQSVKDVVLRQDVESTLERTMQRASNGMALGH